METGKLPGNAARNEEKPDLTFKFAGEPLAFMRWIGTFNNGVHSIELSGDRLAAASIWVNGWQGGANGRPVWRAGITTKSIQIEHVSTTTSKIQVTFEVSGGQSELGLHEILFPA